MIRRFAVIGRPVAHSFSPGYFARKFVREGIDGCVYEAFRLETIDELPRLLATCPDLCGLNVTSPFKEGILPYLDELDDEAARLRAVNCVRIDRGRLTGYNTDLYGFGRALDEWLGDRIPPALVLGSGGAARAVCRALEQRRIEALIVSRTPAVGTVGYDALDREILNRYRLIVNCTPLGMNPYRECAPPIPYPLLGPTHRLFDLIYNPTRTHFMALGLAAGAEIRNGLRMLELQADASWEIWNR